MKLHAPLAGNGKACASAAAAYLEGRGVPRDEAKAAVLLGKGCESSSARACSDLCDLYIDGKGVPKNAAVRTSS